jgi:asparagine synthase (glutamine-hydrolysing)
MCGIAGLFGRFPPGTAEAMDGALAHRGPDDCDIYEDEAAGLSLVHRRLAIVDLSPLGHQPMPDASGRFVLCYNGEIYNAPEIRDSLEQRGVRFRGHSDSEVLVELLARDGADALGRLNGIFAFALWDRHDRALTLVRDGLGVKPLYWTETSSGIAFASEIKALLAVPGLERQVDPVAAAAYLTYLWSPGERTMFRSVKKLEPGSWLRVEAGGRQLRGHFYRLPDPSPNRMSDADAIEGTRAHLAKAVERQMMGDVEVGAFLSGGLDSSSLVYFARQHSDRPIRCFTARYDNASDELGEHDADLPYARAMATHFGAELHEVSIDDSIADEFPRLIAALDEPTADMAALLSFKISEGARAAGLKVLLSGTGGDDVLTGYRRHLAAVGDPLVDLIPAFLQQRLARLGTSRSAAPNPQLRRLAKYASTLGRDPLDRIIGRFEWLSADAATDLLAADVGAADVRHPLRQALQALPSTDPIERTLRIDQLFFLSDHNLNYSDKTGMAHGIEIRVPFLDTEFLDWASRLPRSAKLRGTTTKWVLRKAMEPFLPSNVIKRRKTGFGVPLRSWMRGRMRPMMEDLLSPQTVTARGLLDPLAIGNLKDATLEGRTDGAYSLLGVMAVELWARAFIDSPPAAAQLTGPTRRKRGMATSNAVPSSSTI